MNIGEYLPSNNLFILIAVLAIAIIGLLLFLRKPQNRHPMAGPRGHELEERRSRQNAQGVVETPPTRQ